MADALCICFIEIVQYREINYAVAMILNNLKISDIRFMIYHPRISSITYASGLDSKMKGLNSNQPPLWIIVGPHFAALPWL